LRSGETEKIKRRTRKYGTADTTQRVEKGGGGLKQALTCRTAQKKEEIGEQNDSI